MALAPISIKYGPGDIRPVKSGAILVILLLIAGSLALPSASAAPQLVHHYPQVEQELRAIETAHPDLATVKSIGKSSLGLDLWHIMLTDMKVTGLADSRCSSAGSSAEGAACGPKYKVYMDGGHHGNEVLGVELVFLYINYLVLGYDAKDPEVMNLLAQNEFHLTPMLNPDGNMLDTRKNGNQVDLNRNYPYEWGTDGASADITAGNYHGPQPLSESEIRANTELAAKNDWDVWVTMHTGVAEFYWPWSYTNDDPPDHEMFVAMEKPFEAATNGRVDAMQSAELYIADGDTEDFAYGSLGIPAFVFEVHEDQTVPVYPEELTGVLKDQFNGLKWVVANTPKYGANLTVVSAERSGALLNLTLRNDGLGPARNLSLAVKVGGQAQYVSSGGLNGDERLAPGATTTLTIPLGAAPVGSIEVSGTYSQLLIGSSRTKTLAYSSGEASPLGLSDGPARVPGFELPLVMLTALAAVTFSRRKA